jgi:hypothetical protein
MVVASIRVSAVVKARWFAAAAARGLEFSPWARQALDDQAELEAALDRERRVSEREG